MTAEELSECHKRNASGSVVACIIDFIAPVCVITVTFCLALQRDISEGQNLAPVLLRIFVRDHY